MQRNAGKPGEGEGKISRKLPGRGKNSVLFFRAEGGRDTPFIPGRNPVSSGALSRASRLNAAAPIAPNPLISGEKSPFFHPNQSSAARPLLGAATSISRPPNPEFPLLFPPAKPQILPRSRDPFPTRFWGENPGIPDGPDGARRCSWSPYLSSRPWKSSQKTSPSSSPDAASMEYFVPIIRNISYYL